MKRWQKVIFIVIVVISVILAASYSVMLIAYSALSPSPSQHHIHYVNNSTAINAILTSMKGSMHWSLQTLHLKYQGRPDLGTKLH
jgi:hypothetical protein